MKCDSWIIQLTVQMYSESGRSDWDELLSWMCFLLLTQWRGSGGAQEERRAEGRKKERKNEKRGKQSEVRFLWHHESSRSTVSVPQFGWSGRREKKTFPIYLGLLKCVHIYVCECKSCTQNSTVNCLQFKFTWSKLGLNAITLRRRWWWW